jgi:diadenosine tetraphosphatase ApaH/serine/threonine PP2A family protein phosphatase
MKYAIISDIHGNTEALTAVLDDIERNGGVDGIWCLGDVTGYGAEPGACIAMLRDRVKVCIAGNHDRGSIEKLDLPVFNDLAQQALRWMWKNLLPDEKAWLGTLPTGAEDGDYLLVHASPSDPLLEYVLSTGIAERNFSFFRTKYCFYGHTHVPMVYKLEGGGLCTATPLTPAIGLTLGETRMMINPGSVGQPRDGDPRASYGILDAEGSMFRLHRVAYDIEATQAKIMKAGLPVQLATRLEQGR